MNKTLIWLLLSLTILLVHFCFHSMLVNIMNSLSELSCCDICAIAEPPDKHVPETVLIHVHTSTVIFLDGIQLTVWYAKMITNILPFCNQFFKPSKESEIYNLFKYIRSCYHNFIRLYPFMVEIIIPVCGILVSFSAIMKYLPLFELTVDEDLSKLTKRRLPTMLIQHFSTTGLPRSIPQTVLTLGACAGGLPYFYAMICLLWKPVRFSVKVVAFIIFI